MNLKRFVFTALAVVLCTPWALGADESAVESVSGRVFLDANANGRLDAGEKGVAGVGVTDSVDFVTTGADGSYAITIADDPMIPYAPARVVSVSWPSGRWPTGRWWRRLSEIKAGEKVNFGLRDDEQKLPFVFVHITDDHGNGGMYPVFARQVEKMGDMARFCINTGDLGYASLENAEDMFSSVAKNAKSFPIPMLFTPGNHDLVGGHDGTWKDAHPLVGNGGFTKYVGPIRWSFDYAGAHFFGVDWMHGANGKIAEGPPGITSEWLERDLKRLKPGTRIFGFVHFPSGHESFFAVMRKYKVVHVFGGHNHAHRRYFNGGIPATTAISLRGNGGCNLGVVGENDFDVVYFCSGCKAGQPEYHSRRLCAIKQLEYTLIPSLKRRRGKHHTLVEKKLDGTESIKAAQTGAIEIAAEIEPGAAGKVGLRIGRGRTVEIAFDGKTLTAAGAVIPFWLREGEKALKWHLVIENNAMTFYANSLIRLDKAVTVDHPAEVTVFAEGQGAHLKRLDVWELKAKP